MQHPSDVNPMTVQLDSNALATSCTISGATLRGNNAPTSLKMHPSDVMPTIVQLDSNALATSCTISGATLRDNVAPTFQKPTKCRRHADIKCPTRSQCSTYVGLLLG